MKLNTNEVKFESYSVEKFKKYSTGDTILGRNPPIYEEKSRYTVLCLVHHDGWSFMVMIVPWKETNTVLKLSNIDTVLLYHQLSQFVYSTAEVDSAIPMTL